MQSIFHFPRTTTNVDLLAVIDQPCSACLSAKILKRALLGKLNGGDDLPNPLSFRPCTHNRRYFWMNGKNGKFRIGSPLIILWSSVHRNVPKYCTRTYSVHTAEAASWLQCWGRGIIPSFYQWRRGSQIGAGRCYVKGPLLGERCNVGVGRLRSINIRREM